MNIMISKIAKGLKQKNIQVLIIITSYFLFSSYTSLTTNQLFYTFSLLLKDILIWVMPVTACFFIAHTVHSFERRAPVFILILLSFEAVSNFSSVWYAFCAAHSVADYLPTLQSASLENDFKALWRLPFTRPTWWSADKGVFMGLALGGLSAFSARTSLKSFINRGKGVMEWALVSVFSVNAI